jgi:uncharacterized protein
MGFSPAPSIVKHKSRGFRRWLIRSLSQILAVILLFLTYIFHVEPNWYDVHQVSLTLPNLPAAFDRYRIVELTDLHVDNFRDIDRLQKIVQLTAQQQPNLVVMVGDYITGAVSEPNEVKSNGNGITIPYQTMPHLKILEMLTQLTTAGTNRLRPEKYLPTLAAGLQHLHAPDGVLAVLGNHDRWNWNPKFMKTLQDLGIKVLENDLTQIQRGTERLQIAGVGDFLAKQADLQPILAKMGESTGAILLAHEPDFADVSAATGKFDLQLSGHSHGGQVYIPGLKRTTPPLAAKYPAGQYRVDRMIQYTSRGIGMVTPRVRFNCRPEITVLTLRSTNQAVG